MRKWYLAIFFVLAAAFLPMIGARAAAVTSSDTMILEWSASKVWTDKGELCVRGTFVNKRSDLSITKVNDFEIRINFTRADGSRYQFVGHPKKIPMVKLSAGASRTVTLNFGPFDDTWKDWVTTENYVFSYISAKRW